MFLINEDYSIYLTRGDTVCFQVSAMVNDNDKFMFRTGDVVQFKAFEKKACENVVLQKDFVIEEDTEIVTIYLEEADTKIGDFISKPTDYWYEVTLNPYTSPQTFICYDEDGAKVLRLFPEGANIEELPVEEGSAFEKVIKDTVLVWLQEGGAVSEEQIEKAVSDYLSNNQIQTGATEEEAKQITDNKTNIENHKKDTNVHVTKAEKETWNNKSNFSGSYNDLTDKPTIPEGADLTGYATENYVKNYAQPKGNYLNTSDLAGAINNALAQAKASGQFDGKTPVKGTDYWTESDKAEIKSYVDEAILGGEW